jgi:carbon monoxide dehydrogenase subunit G
MKIRGSCILSATKDKVFAAINDPGALLQIIPGCQEIRQVSETEYRGQIFLRLPAVVGLYQTYVRMTDREPDCSGHFEGQVDGALGTIKGKASFTLIDRSHQTLMEYEGDGQIYGSLARLDTRFTEWLAKSLIDLGLARLNKQLQGQEMPASTP